MALGGKQTRVLGGELPAQPSKAAKSDAEVVDGILRHTRPVASSSAWEWYSVQAGFWRSLWLVLRGGRLREWKYLAVGTVPNLMPEEDE